MDNINYSESGYAAKRVLNYILGMVVFVSIYFINFKLININLNLSLITFLLMEGVYLAYLLNNSKYVYKLENFVLDSLVKLIFDSLYITCFFNSKISLSNKYFVVFCIFSILLVNVVSYFFYLNLSNKLVKASKVRIFLIILKYLCTSYLIMVLVAALLYIETNFSIIKYINNNVELTSGGHFTFISSSDLSNYLSHKENVKADLFNNKELDIKDLRTLIYIKYEPITSFNDLFIVSAQNYLGVNSGIRVYGEYINIIFVIERLIALILFLSAILIKSDD